MKSLKNLTWVLAVAATFINVRGEDLFIYNDVWYEITSETDNEVVVTCGNRRSLGELGDHGEVLEFEPRFWEGECYAGDIVIPRKVTHPASRKTYTVVGIGEAAFIRCYDLESVKLPASIQEIGKYAFKSCKNLVEVNIPEGITTIPSYCFTDCIKLPKLVLPESCRTLEPDSFESCGKWAEDGFEITGTENLTLLSKYCFFDTGLKELPELNPEAVIGECVFKGSALVTIKIPEDPNLASKLLTPDMFKFCDKLKSLELPEEIDGSINVYDCFHYCENIENIYCHNMTPPRLELHWQEKLTRPATLHVPDEALEAYSSHQYWSSFRSIIPFSAGVKEAQPSEIILKGNRLIIPQGTAVTVYDLSGNPILVEKEKDTILLPGIYIVKTEKECMKIAVH